MRFFITCMGITNTNHILGIDSQDMKLGNSYTPFTTHFLALLRFSYLEFTHVTTNTMGIDKNIHK